LSVFIPTLFGTQS